MGYGNNEHVVIRTDNPEFAAQLAEKADKVSPIKNTKLQPLITFVDDDARMEVFSKLKPLYDSKGIKGVIAVPAGLINGANTLTTAQLLQLQNEGWEISGHSVTHSDMLTNMTIENAEIELKDCLTQLTALGFKNVNNFVYPWNASNYEIQKIMKKYYKMGVGQIETYPTNGIPLFTGELTRCNLGAYVDANKYSAIPGLVETDTANTLNYYKSLVDYAVSTNTWLVFVTHCFDTPDAQLALLGQTIDYVKSLNIPIVTLNEGYKVFANRYEDGAVGDDSKDPDGTLDFNMVDRNGVRHSGKELLSWKGDSTKLIIGSLLSDYRIGVTYTTYFGTTTFPESSGGVLTTIKTKEDSQSYQLWKPTNSTTIYVRCWIQSSNAWGSFIDNTAIKAVTTANRPSTAVIGQHLYDTTINKPIWRNAENNRWFNADGVAAENKGINVAITTGATSFNCVFTTQEINSVYGVEIAPSWNTTWWVVSTEKYSTQFTVRFGTAAPANATIDWSIKR